MLEAVRQRGCRVTMFALNDDGQVLGGVRNGCALESSNARTSCVTADHELPVFIFGFRSTTWDVAGRIL